jgi:hypothetical protein
METTLNDVPTTAEFEARTIAAADYLIESDTLARVTLVDTATTVTGGATETKQDTAQTDLDTITGANGVILTDNAITASKYDESTAFPLTAVNGSTLTEAGGTGDQLTAINLPNQTMDIVGNITGNLSGSVNSVTVAVVTDAASRTASKASASDVAGANVNMNQLTGSAGNATALADFAVQGYDSGTNQVNGVKTVDTTTALTTNNDKAGYTLSSAGVDAVLDEEVDNDGTAISLRGAQKLMLSILTGVSSGGGSATITFKKLIDGTTTRISATVDANGNRTAVGTRDAT